MAIYRRAPVRAIGTDARFAACLLVLMFWLVASPHAVHAEGINLSWDDCGQAGAALKTFACDANTGTPFSLVASFVPPAGVDEFLGLSASLDLTFAGPTVPDWWAHGAGRCRGTTGLATSFDFTTGPSSCSDFYAGSAVGGNAYDVGYGAPNRARLRVQAAVPFDNRGPVDPAKEYYAFKVLVLRSKTTGTGSCMGCLGDASIVLKEIRLYQTPEAQNDPVIQLPLDRNVAYWQGASEPVPEITALAPAAGAPGTPVAIGGIHFTGATSVRFASREASFAVVTGERIEATVPDSARTGPVFVTAPAGTGTSRIRFIVAPAIAIFVPHQAPEGSSVLVHGFNFETATGVEFNGLAAPFTILSDTTLTAIVPPGATDGPISVINPGGSATSADVFRVGPFPAGQVNLSWDDCGAAGAETKAFACDVNSGFATLVASFVPPPDINEMLGLTAEILLSSGPPLPDWWKHGAGFCRGSGSLTAGLDFRSGPFTCADFWNGRASGSLAYDVDYFGPGTARIRVSASIPGVSRGPVLPTREYYAFGLVLALNRATGAGSCPGCEASASLLLEHIQLLQPADAGYDPVLNEPLVRSTAYWQGSPGPRPEIHGFEPAGGYPGTAVTIVGAHFETAESVRFHETEAEFSIISDTLITTAVPAGASTGHIYVATRYGTATSDRPFFLGPVIEFFTPGQSPVGSSIAIAGRNFSGTTRVEFHGVGASYSIVEDSLLRATVPVGATDGPITVVNPGGSAVSGVFNVGGLREGTLNLSWDDCGAFGIETRTSACAEPSGPYDLIASFVPPEEMRLHGLVAELRIASSAALPDWWKFGVGGCRGFGLTSNFDTRGRVSACADPWIGGAVGNATYEIGYDGPSTARLQVSGGLIDKAYNRVMAGTEYNAFSVSVPGTHTRLCPGCDQPVAISLEQLQLFQHPDLGYDPVLTAALGRNVAYWQGVPGPLPEIRSFEPTAGAPGAIVTIRGTHFESLESVAFHTVAAEFTAVSDSVIQATVPAEGRTGSLHVRTVHGETASDSIFIVAPVVLGLSPPQAPIGDTIRVEGHNLTRATRVEFAGGGATFEHARRVAFAGVPAAFEIVSDSLLSATVPEGATDGPITVTNPGGSSTSPGAFRIGPRTPELTIDDVIQPEGNTGDMTLFPFTVSLTRPSAEVVTVDFSTVDGTATVAQHDYVAAVGTLTIPPGELTATIPVVVIGDDLMESNETFTVVLGNPINASILNGQGLAIIEDDDVTTGALLSRFEAEAVGDGVALRWQFGDAALVVASWVERADEVSGPWVRVAGEVQSEGNWMTLVDRGVEVEHTYQYRLVAQLAGEGTTEFGPIGVIVDQAVKESALTRVAPNPTTGPAWIEYTVAHETRVRLSVLDAQGRMVAVLVDGLRPAGRHQAVWNCETARGIAPAGLYFVRYEAPGKSLVKRITLTR